MKLLFDICDTNTDIQIAHVVFDGHIKSIDYNHIYRKITIKLDSNDCDIKMMSAMQEEDDITLYNTSFVYLTYEIYDAINIRVEF